MPRRKNHISILLIWPDMEQNTAGPTWSRMGSESNKEPEPDGTQLSSHFTLATDYRPWNAMYY